MNIERHPIILKLLPESLKGKMRGSNGGTSVAGRSQILDSFGYDCDNRANQSLAEISQQIENGKGAIINVDHRVLNKQRDVTAMNPVGTDHALTITGIEKDVAGKTVHNGTYLDFLNSVDQYIDTHPRDPNYDSRRDTVFDWISNLKAKRRIN